MATLQDVLMGGYQPPMVGGADYQPQAVDPSLYDQAFAPADIGPPPVVSKPNRLAQVLMGFGDALNSSASILGRTDVRTHNLASYQDYLESQKNAAEQYDRLKASQASESGRSKARFLLDKNERDQIARQEAEGRAADKAARVAEAQAKRDQEVADEANRRTFELGKQAAGQKFDQEMQKSRFIHDEGMAKLDARLKGGDKGAEKDLKDFSTGTQVIAGFENGLPPGKDGSPAVPPLAERLKSGEDPDDIRRHLEDELDQAGIFGAPRDLVRNRFNEKMLRTNRQLQKEAEQQPPPGQ